MSKTKTYTITHLKNPEEEQKKKEEKKLVLKSLSLKEKKNVSWAEDTVDNEHMGKKKSKICCIFHRPRLNPDDPSSDESCSSCDEKGKNAYERPNHYEKLDKKHGNSHNNKGCCEKK